MPEGFDFKGKLGPLPVWLWGVIAGVLALIGYLIYARTGKAGESAGSSTAGTATNLDAMGYQTSGIKGGSATTETTVPENNVTWLSRVSRSVADTLAASPSEVYAALYKYVTGQAITEKEKAYVDKGIQIGMNPPEGTQGVSEVVTTDTARKLTKYVRRADGEISALYSDNTRDPLSLAEWLALGSPSYEQMPDSSYNSFKVV